MNHSDVKTGLSVNSLPLSLSSGRLNSESEISRGLCDMRYLGWVSHFPFGRKSKRGKVTPNYATKWVKFSPNKFG